MLYLAYGSKEKTSTGQKFLNNYINKREKQGDKAKNQLYKFVAYNIKWKRESRCVKPEFMYGHVRYKLRNSLGGYGGIRVVRVSDDSGSSSRERGGVVAKSAVVHSRWCVKNPSEFLWVLMAVACLSLHASVGQSDAFEDFRCLNSNPLDQVGSGNFFRGKIYDWLKKGILLMWINFLHSRPEALRGASCAKTHFIHCFGNSRQANIRSNATFLQPCVCFLNDIVNRERSESCYITVLNNPQELICHKTQRNQSSRTIMLTWEGYEPLIPHPSNGLNSTTAALLQGWYNIKQRN